MAWVTSAVEKVSAALDRPWSRSPRVAMTLVLLASAVTLINGALGPSAVALSVGPRTSLLPPWYLPVGWVKVNEWVGVVSLWLAISVGGVGLWIALRAIRCGWRPHVRRLFAVGVGLNVLTSLVLPLTSADVLMYAAYGRLQVIGRDPYQITPAEIFREQFDVVLKATERPWQDTPSVYGPIASFTQWLANVLGGENMHDIVFWLQMFALIPFVLTCAIAVKLAHGEPATQARAVFLTILNPLLIWAVTAQAHNEALGVVFAIFGVAMLRKHPVLAGVGIGLAGCVKISLVFYGLAMIWAYRRDWKRLGLLAAGTAIPLGLLYGLRPDTLLAATRNTGYVSSGSWASWVYWPMAWSIGEPAAKVIVNVISLAGMVGIAWMLSQVLPRSAVAGLAPLADATRDPLTIAMRTALALCTAWLVTSPYTLSWYDLISWVPLAVLVANPLDTVLMVRGAWLSMAFVTGRVVQFSPQMLTASWVVRDLICPLVQIGVLAYIVWWWWSERRNSAQARRVHKRVAAKRARRASPTVAEPS